MSHDDYNDDIVIEKIWKKIETHFLKVASYNQRGIEDTELLFYSLYRFLTLSLQLRKEISKKMRMK